MSESFVCVECIQLDDEWPTTVYHLTLHPCRLTGLSVDGSRLTELPLTSLTSQRSSTIGEWFEGLSTQNLPFPANPEWSTSTRM